MNNWFFKVLLFALIQDETERAHVSSLTHNGNVNLRTKIFKKTSVSTRATQLTRSALNNILFVWYSIYKHDSLSPNTCKLAEGVSTQKKDVTPLQLINAIHSLPVKVNTHTSEHPFAALKLEYTYCFVTLSVARCRVLRILSSIFVVV